MSHVSWRSWCVPVAGALVLASSFAPWWVLRLGAGGRLDKAYGSHIGAFSAWRAPGWWAFAVALALAVAAVWTGWRLIAGDPPGWLRGLLILASVAPIVLAVHQWQEIPPKPPLRIPSPSGLVINSVSRPGDPFIHPGMDPHQLYREDSLSSWQGPGWGLYAGVTSLVLLTAALLVGAKRDHTGTNSPEAP